MRQASHSEVVARWLVRICAGKYGRAAVRAKGMPALGATVGGLDVDLGVTRQEAKCLRRCRNGDAKHGASENLAVRAIADSYALRIHVGFVGDLPAMT